MRVKLTIEYDGLNFFGWQKQEKVVSVQETIEKAIQKVFNFSDSMRAIELYGAGRTDTGVHATGQVAHFDILDDLLAEKWKCNISKLSLAINFYLIDTGIVITKSEIVPYDFHARFSAKMRHYRYLIYNRMFRSVIYQNRAWHVAPPLNVSLMDRASKFLIGTHNLNAFRSAHCGALNPTRTINKVRVYGGDGINKDLIIVEISARSFLHNQVRITVGTLVQIGQSKFPPEYIKELLQNQDRTKAGVTAPPYGLYLSAIDY